MYELLGLIVFNFRPLILYQFAQEGGTAYDSVKCIYLHDQRRGAVGITSYGGDRCIEVRIS